MKMHRTTWLALAASLCWLGNPAEGKAQVGGETKEPAAEPKAKGKGGEGEGMRRGTGKGGPGGMGKGTPGRNGPAGRGGDPFQNLSEDERSRVRQALEKVWSKPEVRAAREKVSKANEELRVIIKDTLMEVEPDLVAVLEKLHQGRGGDRRSPGPWRAPDPAAPDFARMMVRRLEAELLTFTPMDRRDDARKLHEQIMQLPELQTAVAKLDEAPVEKRFHATESLRSVYREAMTSALRKIREAEKSGSGAAQKPL